MKKIEEKFGIELPDNPSNSGITTRYENMSAVYDRHEYIKDLTGAGLNEPQAEAIALGAVRVQESALATKEDMAELKMDIARLEASTKEDIGKLEKDIARLEGRIGKLEWMLGFNLALTAAVLLALIFR